MHTPRQRADYGAAPLVTDFYQLAMLQAYWREGMSGLAVFEFFVRRLHPRRNFLVACGLEQVVQYLENLRFQASDIEWLRSTGKFQADFLQWLQTFRFEGDVHAMPEGTVFFQDEPILRVTAPLAQAQFVESRIVNLLHYQTLIASKAARMVMMAPQAMLIDFGMRRAHGIEAALFAARAAYAVGFAGSATIESERAFGVPSFGTMAHSFIQAHTSERDAFVNFARAFPDNVILLLDTYDTIAAARGLAEIAWELQRFGIAIKGVRLDSGDLLSLSREVRGILDSTGLSSVKIFASSSVDEDLLATAADESAPIDGYGIGTHLTTSADVPFLDCAYKLQEYEGTPRRKRSPGKATWPGRKQVFRRLSKSGQIIGDVVALDSEAVDGSPLLQPIMHQGKRLGPPETMGTIRERVGRNLDSLPPSLRVLRRSQDEPLFQARISDNVHRLAIEADLAAGAKHS